MGGLLNIACVYTGAKFDREYVHKLFRSLQRYGPVSFRFHVFTDDPSQFRNPRYVTHRIGHPLHSYWDKLHLFKAGEFERDDRVLYFDLDVLIRGSVAALVERAELFIMVRDGIRAHRWNSSVMMWTVSAATEYLWDSWVRAKCPLRRAISESKGDQAWIECQLRDFGPIPRLWQDLIPGVVVPAYGPGLDAANPDYWTRLTDPGDASVVVFHGRPRLHENELPWVKEAWT